MNELTDMMDTEYKGMIERIKFFWRFRCVKLRLIMETIGLITVFSFGIVMLGATIIQWHTGHKITFIYNRYNEAFLEYIWALIAVPCVLYFFKTSGMKLVGRWKQNR